MARQYDVEDLLNSDATDPDGEPTPIATNDDVRDGKIIIETVDGTGKIGDVSQIVADYLKKSAGFFTEIRPYYIVRPAMSQAWTGTWELFLHGIDDGGLSDAVNITIGINGVVVHTEAWTASTGARDIEFSISPTESTALIATPPTGSYARCYVAFHDSEGNEIVIRHFSLKLVDTVPKIPEAEIPDSIARDDEVTAAIAAALAAHPGAFSANLALGNYENANGGAIAGHYVRESATQVDVSYRNIANENKETEIRAIQRGYGLKFGDKIFVIEWTNENASYRSFNGFWAADEVDATAESSTVAISVIQHELRMIRFLTASQLKGLLPEVQTAFDKTVDIHLQERPGDFVNMNDAAVAGIALVENTTANRNALNARNYNFAGLTWQTTSVDIPDDGNDYWVVVRVARALGNIETQFQFLSSDPEAGIEHLRFSRQGDDTWHYYQVVADTESVWTMQRRATATHTRWDAPLGDPAIRQVQALIPPLIPPIPQYEGLTPQQKAQFESLVAKTADLLIETRETWVAATNASFLALPADNAQLIRVRAGNAPQGLTGWTTDVTTTEPRVILIRVPAAARLADYRILLGDDNAVRLDSYGVDATGSNYAYMTSTSLSLQAASRIRLQHHGSDTHTRFIGMLADAIMARLLPMLPDTGERNNKVPQFDGDNLVWQVLTGGGGLTASERARLLPNIPNAGDRNLKIAQYVNDVLTWKAIEGFVTQDAFDNRENHTPNRASHLPVRLEPQEQVVLVEDSHWADEYYRFRPVGHDVTRTGVNYKYQGVNAIAFSTDLPIFGNSGLPNIFRADRIAAFYAREAGIDRWRPKIVIDKALLPTLPGGAVDELGLAIGVRGGGITRTESLTRTSFDSEGSTGQLQELSFGGKTYIAFSPDGISSEGNTRLNWQWLENTINVTPPDAQSLLGRIDFHISRTDQTTGDVTFLSNDLNTAWASADEYPADLYEGDANGHPIRAELPSKAIWDHVVARSNTYFSGTSPDPAAGVDGQFWVNLRTGQIHQKQSGTWTLITDVALQTEISRAIEWSTIPNNTSIPANFITKHSNRYFGAKLQHVKTSGSTAPTGDATNWIELSNEASAGSSAVAVEWSSIAQNSGVALGTIVKHGNYTYMCITAHNRRGNGPDSDSTNWQLLTNYQGTWATGYYHSGAIVNVGRNVYIALQNVLNTDPSPTATTNTKWLQINNTEPPARYAELTINAAVALSGTYASLTFAAALAKSQNATGIIARASSGSAITIAAGSYVADTHIVVAGSSDNARSNYDIQLYDGTNIIDEKTHVGYVRETPELDDESFSSHHIFTVTQATTLQVRVKISQTSRGTSSINTAAGGTVIIRKL